MRQSSRAPCVLIAGGGTGGHVFPGLAVAEALRTLADVDIVFAGTPRGLETRVIPPLGYALELLDVEPIKGGGPKRAVRGAIIAARETTRALAIVRRIAPRAVLSVGGYAAGPIALAAVLASVPLAVLEPNSVIGFANRVLVPLAARAYVAWPHVARSFRRGRAMTLGVPLRAAFAPQPYVSSSRANVLVLGGSQGATALNERLPAAVKRASAQLPGLQVLHQAGKDRHEAVRNAYAALGVDNVTVVPFIDDVAAEMARADLVICRAGAVTVAELSAIGRASLLIPFPHASDDHQAKNALSLEALGGAVCLRQNVADDVRIASELTRLLSEDAARMQMADRARQHGKPHASLEIARDLLDLAKIEPRRAPVNESRRTGGGSSPQGHQHGRHAEAL